MRNVSKDMIKIVMPEQGKWLLYPVAKRQRQLGETVSTLHLRNPNGCPVDSVPLNLRKIIVLQRLENGNSCIGSKQLEGQSRERLILMQSGMLEEAKATGNSVDIGYCRARKRADVQRAFNRERD